LFQKITVYGPLARRFGTRFANSLARLEGAEDTLRITLNEAPDVMEMRLEGRITGPFADELNRVWVEAASRLASKQLIVNLRDVTYADVRGKQVLREICAQTKAKLVASTPWTQFLAAEVAATRAVAVEEETENAGNARKHEQQ
jgi:hypothetical protein